MVTSNFNSFILQNHDYPDWGMQRFVCRTGMMVAVVFVAETVPNFGVLLDLVGGSTITLMALVFPVIFNIYLTAAKRKFGEGLADSTEKPLSFSEYVVLLL
jgi:hypothetical protein